MPCSLHLHRGTIPAAPPPLPEPLAVYHSHLIRPNQCTSTVIQPVKAPLHAVWSLLRRFDNPQAYKHFLKSCQVIDGHGGIGTLREVRLVSGLPAACSREMLEILDEESHVTGFRIVGGDHRLENYHSVTTVHRGEGEGTAEVVVVVESYVVDVPEGNTEEETRVFVDTIVQCNLRSLARIAAGHIRP
ncbi:hypothetical protein MLD38_024121 [Melastoma candidum]|uniref:Uncharacterized protein n=1 Tax=Melastoma candidum TaxID=119954 RepID=A0ACB9NRD0_9MYRT|nr:hypothetical protein MLD38_024121 [Melastoma candidum]